MNVNNNNQKVKFFEKIKSIDSTNYLVKEIKSINSI